MRVHRAIETSVADVVGQLQQLCAGEGTARLARQDRQQIELRRRQLDCYAAAPYRTALQVDHQITHAQQRRRLARPFGPAQHGAHARDQFARAEGLGDIIIGAELQADQPIGFLDARREHNDRQRVGRRVGAQRARHVEPIHPGQHQVQHQQARAFGAHQP